jgi:hypothetical protein
MKRAAGLGTAGLGSGGESGRGKATSIFETDVTARDDMRYYSKNMADPITEEKVILFCRFLIFDYRLSILFLVLVLWSNYEA